MPRQKLGQHFLRSQNILERIARAACGDRVELAVEIGPGRGALTEHLLRHADRVVAIEIDRQLGAALRSRWGENPAIGVVEGDAASIDLTRWGPGVLAGNLPYYVSTAIISRYIRRPGALRQAVFLIQQEVAERITARPGTRDYGYFSVECQFLANVENLFRVRPGAFQPPPKVDSAVIRLIPRADEAAVDANGFLRFVSFCFRQKRKTLRNNLATVYSRDVVEMLPGMSRRAEELTVRDFLNLYSIAESAQKPAMSICAAEPGSGAEDMNGDLVNNPG